MTRATFSGASACVALVEAQRAQPVISLMTRHGAQLPYLDWSTKSAQPIVFRHDWPAAAGCAAP